MFSGKTCSVCKTLKDFSEFGRRKATSDGHRSQCKSCDREAAKRYRAADPEASKQRNRRHYERHRESRIESTRSWRANNPEKAKETALRAKAKSRTETWALALVTGARNVAKKKGLEFDIDVEWIESLWGRQQGRCFWYHILMQPADELRNPLQPSIDRINPAKGYTKSNVVLACAAANRGRNTTHADTFRRFADSLEANFKSLA